MANQYTIPKTTFAYDNDDEPVVVIFTNGGWKVMPKRDADFLAESAEEFFNYVPVSAIFTDLVSIL